MPAIARSAAHWVFPHESQTTLAANALDHKIDHGAPKQEAYQATVLNRFPNDPLLRASTILHSRSSQALDLFCTDPDAKASADKVIHQQQAAHHGLAEHVEALAANVSSIDDPSKRLANFRLMQMHPNLSLKALMSLAIGTHLLPLREKPVDVKMRLPGARYSGGQAKDFVKVDFELPRLLKFTHRESGRKSEHLIPLPDNKAVQVTLRMAPPVKVELAVHEPNEIQNEERAAIHGLMQAKFSNEERVAFMKQRASELATTAKNIPQFVRSSTRQRNQTLHNDLAAAKHLEAFPASVHETLSTVTPNDLARSQENLARAKEAVRLVPTRLAGSNHARTWQRNDSAFSEHGHVSAPSASKSTVVRPMMQYPALTRTLLSPAHAAAAKSSFIATRREAEVLVAMFGALNKAVPKAEVLPDLAKMAIAVADASYRNYQPAGIATRLRGEWVMSEEKRTLNDTALLTRHEIGLANEADAMSDELDKSIDNRPYRAHMPPLKDEGLSTA